MTKVIVITGATSGIGRQAAIDLAKQGYQVVGGARHIVEDPELTALQIDLHQLDVTDHESVKTFIHDIQKRYQRIDVLINSAGYGSFGALEEVPLTEAQNQMEVNLMGVVDLIQLVTHIMRKQKHGRIINVSSMAGRSYGALGGWYYISKHALETMSDVLRVELKDFGIQVVIVEPGNTKTNWQAISNQHLLETTPLNSPYRTMAENHAKVLADSTDTVADVSKTMLRAVSDQRPRRRYQVKLRERFILFLSDHVGSGLRDWFAGQLVR